MTASRRTWSRGMWPGLLLWLLSLTMASEAVAQVEVDRVEWWRRQLIVLEAAETALEGRMLETAAQIALADRALDTDVIAYDLWRSKRQAVAEFCRTSAQLSTEAVHLARTAMGAGFGVAQQLETAREFTCRTEGDFRGFLAALQNANRMSADAIRLLESARQRRRQMHAEITGLAARGVLLVDLMPAFTDAGWMELQRLRTAPALASMAEAIELRAELVAAAARLAGRRQGMHEALKSEAQKTGSDQLWRLGERIAEPRPWSLTQARVDLERDDLAAREQAVEEALAALGAGAAPDSCGNLAAIEQSYSDAEYVARFSVLQVYAINELQKQCAASLPSGPPTAPPGDGAILVRLDAVDCDGPVNQPGEPERMVCDVRWTLTNTASADLVWVSGEHAWQSGERGGNGGVGYRGRVIAAGETQHQDLRCLAFGSPFLGQWAAYGVARDPEAGRDYTWSIAGTCPP